MNPYGSIFVRAETGRYGESIDCLEGTIDFADTAIAFSNLGRLSPDVRIPTPVAAGAPPTGTHGRGGLAGRYAITHQPAAPFAIVPAVHGCGAGPGPDPDRGPERRAEGRRVRSTKLAVKSTRSA